MMKKTGENVYAQIIGVSEAIRTIWTDIHINEPSDTMKTFQLTLAIDGNAWPRFHSTSAQEMSLLVYILRKASSLPWCD